jgi:hypothetical protein
MASLGTRAWVERTGGKLAWHDRLTMIADGVRARAATQKRIKAGAKLRHCEVADILPPDSAIAREAVAISEDACLPFLHNHNLRAYFWARLLDDGRKRFDDETIFVALMLHDLGLTHAYRLEDDKEQCFTIVGARAVDQLAVKHGWSDKRAHVAAQAITLHLNVTVADRFGREAQMVRAGSGADVAGLGLDVLHKDQIDAVITRHPRQDFKQCIAAPLQREAEERPCCRIAFMQKKLGFGTLIRSAPMFRE